jgi:multidrug transporter EmrE-like cation transporter
MEFTGNLKTIGMVCVLASSIIEAIGQLAFKRAANGSGSSGVLTGLHTIIRSPWWIGFGVFCFLAEGTLFSVALRLLDVSVAFPAGSLTFVAIVLLARLWLGEAVGPRRWAGVTLIVMGTALLGIR